MGEIRCARVLRAVVSLSCTAASGVDVGSLLERHRQDLIHAFSSSCLERGTVESASVARRRLGRAHLSDPPPKLSTNSHKPRVVRTDELSHIHMVAPDSDGSVLRGDCRVSRYDLYLDLASTNEAELVRPTKPTSGRSS